MVGKPPRQRDEWVLKIMVSFLYNVLKGKLSVVLSLLLLCLNLSVAIERCLGTKMFMNCIREGRVG